MTLKLINIFEFLATAFFSALFIAVTVLISYNVVEIMFSLIVTSFKINIVNLATYAIPYIMASLFVIFGAWAIHKCSSAENRSFAPLFLAASYPAVIIFIGSFY